MVDSAAWTTPRRPASTTFSTRSWRGPPGLSRADDGRTLPQRRADAFAEIVLTGIATRTHGDAAGRGTGRLRPQVALTVPAEFLAGIPGAPRPLLDHFGVIPTPTVHRLLCDADLTRIILDTTTGLPLDVGRRHRLATGRQRRALATIFRRCAFPGCDIPFRFCDIHHLHWWTRDHGHTDLRLLVPYCWTHHHYLHEYGFTATPAPAGHRHRLIHRRPDGRIIPDPDQPLQTAVQQLRLHKPGHQPDHRSDQPPRTAEPPRPPPAA